MSKKLEDCPFCKSRNLFVEEWVKSYVWCRKCHACGPEHATKEKAITAWNTRAGEKA